MGNNTGLCVHRNQKNDTLSNHLTPRQKLLVQDTLELMKDELPKLGLMVFLKFFETQPQMKKIFPKIVRINDSNQLELDMDMDSLSRHAANVMNSLGAAVESLDQSEFFNDVVENIGQSHGRRKIKPRMLEQLWPSLSFGLKEILQDAYTKEVAQAWKKVYFYLCTHMKKGIKRSGHVETKS